MMMKLVCVIVTILGLWARHINAQDCPPELICPINIPIRSDGRNPQGACESAEGNTVREEIGSNIYTLLATNPPALTLRSKYLGLNPGVPATSCAEIIQNNPSSRTGFYFVSTGTQRSYCNFDLNTQGGLDQYGWQQMENFDMSNPSVNCPNGLEPVEIQGVRFCRKDFNGTGCSTLVYSHAQPIKRMYGRIHGIQSGAPDIEVDQLERGLDGMYLDGVSLTYGTPRQHIWSFFGLSTAALPYCPCSVGATRESPDFVGEHYFCESATNELIIVSPAMTYVNNPIWDGQNCLGTQSVGCCNGNGFFYREFVMPFSGDVELRLCTDSFRFDKDIGLQLVQLWFQ